MNRKKMNQFRARFRAGASLCAWLVWMLFILSGTAFAQELTIVDKAIQSQADYLLEDLRIVFKILDLEKTKSILLDYAKTEYSNAQKEGRAVDYLSFWRDRYFQESRLLWAKREYACLDVDFLEKNIDAQLRFKENMSDYNAQKHSNMDISSSSFDFIPFYLNYMNCCRTLYRNHLVRAKILYESDKKNAEKSKKAILLEAESAVADFLRKKVKRKMKVQSNGSIVLSTNKKMIKISRAHVKKSFDQIRNEFGEEVLLDYAKMYLSPTADSIRKAKSDFFPFMAFKFSCVVGRGIPLLFPKDPIYDLLKSETFLDSYLSAAKKDGTKDGQ